MTLGNPGARSEFNSGLRSNNEQQTQDGKLVARIENQADERCWIIWKVSKQRKEKWSSRRVNALDYSEDEEGGKEGPDEYRGGIPGVFKALIQRMDNLLKIPPESMKTTTKTTSI